MSGVAYPWRWLAEAVGTTFILRYPWMDAVRRATGGADAVCVLLPEAAGGLADWEPWFAESVGRDGPAACLAAAGDFRAVTRALAESYQIGAGYTAGRPSTWAIGFLAECRRQMPHVETVPLLAAAADDACAAGLQDLVRAQRALGYLFVRPVLLRRTLPPGWDSAVVRFGLPEWAGDLNRIAPPPERDVAFWTNLMLALAAAWEASATPRLADELWEQLRLERKASLRDGGFDEWLQRQLEGFARRNACALAPPLPASLAFGPVVAVEDRLWQGGAVAWHEGRYDVTPLQARLWVGALTDPDARESLRRRRLANAPLSRWLSAWGSSIEESLRVAALQAGSAKFRRFLETQPPRQWREGWVRSRWDELDPQEGVFAVDAADFGDLAAFAASLNPGNARPPRLSTLFDLCRTARNRVVHQRKLSAADFLRIASAVEWLSESGLI